MTLLRFVRLFLKVLTRGLYLTARKNSSFVALILEWLLKICSQCGSLLKAKLGPTFQDVPQHYCSNCRKEKSELNLNIFKSDFVNGMLYRYREWANPVAYFCTDTSESEDKTVDESENNSDEGSSRDEIENIVENLTKMGDMGTYNTVMDITSTKAVFECLPEPQITPKRKVELENLESSKRSKSTGSQKVGETSKQTENIADVNNNTSSETSTCYSNESTSSSSDLQSTHVLDESSKCDRIDDNESAKINKECISIDNSNLKFPSEVFLSPRDKKPDFDDLNVSNSKDKSGESSKGERFKEAKSIETESTKKFNPNSKKKFDTPDLQRKKNTSESEPCPGPSRSLQENRSFRTQERQISITLEIPRTSFKPDFPANLGDRIIEDLKSVKSIEENEAIQKFCKDAVEFLSKQLDSVKRPVFSSVLKDVSERSDPESRSAEGPEVPVEIPPNTSTTEIPMCKSYPGFSLKPEKVKKDAMYQKKFYKQRKEITLPKKLREAVQWAAKKPRDEDSSPTSDISSSDENDLPIEEYHEQAPVVAENYITMFDSAKEQKKRKEEDRKLKEEKEQMGRKNTGYIESSFKEESPLSEWSSESLPSSGDSPKKPPTSPVSRPKNSPVSRPNNSPKNSPVSRPSNSPKNSPVSRPDIFPDYNLSMFEISPLKSVEVPPRFLSQQNSLRQHQELLGSLIIRHLSDDENLCKVQSSFPNRDKSLSAVISFIDSGEIVNPEKAIFYRDPIGHGDQPLEKEQLKSFFRIEEVSLVWCTPVSVEEFLHELRLIRETYYRAFYEQDPSNRVFQEYRSSMPICVIPLSGTQDPNKTQICEIDIGEIEDGNTYGKRGQHSKPEHNFTPVVPDMDYSSGMSERDDFETLSDLRSKAKLHSYQSGEWTSKSGKMHQSLEILGRDSVSTFPDVDWTVPELWAIEAPRERFRGQQAEPVLAPVVPDIGYTLNVPEREVLETAYHSRKEARQEFNLSEEETSQSGNIHQSREMLGRDLSASASRSSEWTLSEVELGEINFPRDCFVEQFIQNIPIQAKNIGKECKREEWPDDEYQPYLITEEKVERESPRQESTSSSMNSLPILFGYSYPFQEIMSKITELPNIPESRQPTASWSGSGQSKIPNRRETV